VKDSKGKSNRNPKTIPFFTDSIVFLIYGLSNSQ